MLRDKIALQQAELKAQKSAMVTELKAGLSDDVKAEQVQEAERILASVKNKAEIARKTYKDTINALKADRDYAKDILALVGYKVQNGLRAISHKYTVTNGNVTITHLSGVELKVPYIHAINDTWQKDTRAFVNANGADGNNIAYKISQLVKAQA